MAFSVLSVADALTTAVGLSRGLHETAALAQLMIQFFGIQGFVLFKVSIAVAAAAFALVYDKRLSSRGDAARVFYASLSVSLFFVAVIPVVNNVTLLGWL